MRILRRIKFAYLPKVTLLLGGKARISTAIHLCRFYILGRNALFFATDSCADGSKASLQETDVSSKLLLSLHWCLLEPAATTVELPSLSLWQGGGLCQDHGKSSLTLSETTPHIPSPGSGSLHASQVVITGAKSAGSFQAIK